MYLWSVMSKHNSLWSECSCVNTGKLGFNSIDSLIFFNQVKRVTIYICLCLRDNRLDWSKWSKIYALCKQLYDNTNTNVMYWLVIKVKWRYYYWHCITSVIVWITCFPICFVLLRWCIGTLLRTVNLRSVVPNYPSTCLGI